MAVFFWSIFTIIIVLVILGIYVVPQQNVYIIERLGKYHALSAAGLHVKIPLVDQIASKLSLRILQIDNRVTTKTKDNVFVELDVSVQYQVDQNNIAAAYYQLSNPVEQINAYIEDTIRNAVPTLDLDEAFVQKDNIANEVQQTLQEAMAKFGFVIINTLITDIEPDATVKNAMNSINEAQRKREAAKELAEADKITVVVKAEAQAEQARLQGEGVANQRKAIVNGLAESVREMKKSGLDEREVMSVILTNQYMDVLTQTARSNNAKVLLMPSNADGIMDIQQAIIEAMEMANHRIVESAVAAPQVEPPAERDEE